MTEQDKNEGLGFELKSQIQQDAMSIKQEKLPMQTINSDHPPRLNHRTMGKYQNESDEYEGGDQPDLDVRSRKSHRTVKKGKGEEYSPLKIQKNRTEGSRQFEFESEGDLEDQQSRT